MRYNIVDFVIIRIIGLYQYSYALGFNFLVSNIKYAI